MTTNAADISNLQISDYTNQVKDITIAAQSTDGVSVAGKTRWNNSEWPKQWGFFNTSFDFRTAMLMKGAWITGKGYTTDTASQVLLDNIRGWGKDSFDDIIFNMDVIKRVGMDSYAQIILNPETGNLLNLKPLNPGRMVHVVGDDGLLDGYELNSTVKGKLPKRFEVNEIFHLCHNRLADQIHGLSDMDEETLLAEKESFVDMKKIMHRQARGFIIWKLKTDNTTTIDKIVDKINKARNLGEDTFIPDDDEAIDHEVVQVNVSSLVFDWRNDIRNKFYRNVQLPQIVPGASGQSTESESKAILAAHEVIVAIEQRRLEMQIWNQLGIKLKFNPPGIMQNDLQADEAKDAGAAAQIAQPADTTVGAGR